MAHLRTRCVAIGRPTLLALVAAVVACGQDPTPTIGSSVAVSGDVAVVGAQGFSFPGAVYAFDGLTDGIPDGCQGICPWDLDGGGVGITDFEALLALWGQDPGGPPDFDGDQTVGITDFLELLAHWGECS